MSGHDYSLREYQKKLISEVVAQWLSGNRRILMQSPTGSGKCVDPNTWVWSNGLKRFGDIWGASKIAGPHTTNTVTGWYDDGVREGLQIETDSGWGIDGTYAHRVWIRTKNGFEGWRRLDELKIGDYIGLARGCADFGTKQIPLDEAYTLGVLIADGCIISTQTSNRLQIDKQRPLLEVVLPIIQRWRIQSGGYVNITPSIFNKSGNHDVLIAYAPRLIETLREKYGFESDYSQNRVVPRCILEGTKEVIAAFLRGYFDGDGYCTRTISVSTSSGTLAEQIGQLLLGLGIYCRIRTKDVKNHLPAYIIDIRDIEAFSREVGFTAYGLTKDRSYVKLLSTKRNTNCDTVPGLGYDINGAAGYIEKRTTRKDAWRHSDAYYSNEKQPSYSVLKELVEPLPSCAEKDEMNRIIREHRAWTKVTSINHSIIQRIDCEVEDSHAFVGNGIINHNTVLFSAIARGFTAKDQRVLVVAHREELLLQAKEKLEQITGLPVGIIKAGYPADPTLSIQVASIQTLIRRKYRPEAQLVLIDEAHHSSADSYNKIFEYYANSQILGVTATPVRVDGRGFKNLYDYLVIGTSTAELIKAGYLCGFKLFASKDPIKTSGIKTTAGDFNLSQLAEAIDTSLVMGDLVETWTKYAPAKKTVVFAVNVKHSKQIAQAYLEAGIPAAHLDGETPTEERKAILDRFRTGEILVLTNCGLFAEGLDIPNIEAVQCVRPTKSLVLWLQMLGRSLRPSPGKENAIIIDHTENWFFHGLPDEEREWSLEPISLKSKRWAVECPNCHHIFKPLPSERKSKLATCPDCSANIELKFNGKDKKVSARLLTQDSSAKVEEFDLTKGNPRILAELHELKKIQEKRRYKPYWVYFRLIEKFPHIGLPELEECAKLLGFKPGWAKYKLQEKENDLEMLASNKLEKSFSKGRR